MGSRKKIKLLNDDDFTVIVFRPSTVFGVSPDLGVILYLIV